MGRLKVLDNIGEVGRLTYIGNKTWKSSQGLIYGQGSVHGNRVKHLMDHLTPNSNKPLHTVFNVNKTELLSLMDEAWALRSKGTKVVQGGRELYTIPMGRTVGTQGENAIQIVVTKDTSEIITSFPVKVSTQALS